MSDQAFTKLLERYADGRALCNCRNAYAWRVEDGAVEWPSMKLVVDLRCRHGCQANQLSARDEVARRVVAEFLGGEAAEDAGVLGPAVD